MRERKSACVKQHELMMEFVVVVSKEPEAVITSTAEPFRKIASFHGMAKCLSTICICVCVSVLRGFSLALVLRGTSKIVKLLSLCFSPLLLFFDRLINSLLY